MASLLTLLGVCRIMAVLLGVFYGTSSAANTSQISATTMSTYYLPGACPSTLHPAVTAIYCSPPISSPEDEHYPVFMGPDQPADMTDSAWAAYISSWTSSITIQTLPPSTSSDSPISDGYENNSTTESSSLTSVEYTSPSSALSTSSTWSTSSSQPFSNASSSCAPVTNQTGSMYRGLNMNNLSPSGKTTYRTVADWNQAFSNIETLPGGFNAIRTYSTTDTDSSADGGTEQMVRHLERLLPAAQSYNLSVHVGVWSGGDLGTSRFATEKAALNQTLQKYGCENIIAVSIGNEDIYRNETKNGQNRQPLTDIFTLVNQTQEIMDVLDAHKCCAVPVTHTDTFGEWFRDTSDAVLPLIQQVDFLTVNIFPWWENVTIDNANATFWQHLQEVTDVATKYNKTVWIGETGWPMQASTTDPSIPPGVASVSNMQRYYNEVACSLWNQVNAFFYVDRDISPTNLQSPSFGVIGSDGKPLIDMSCS